jgi:DNA-binding NtrC family response regulator
MERAVFLCEREVISRNDLAIELPAAADLTPSSPTWAGDTLLPLDEVVRRYVHEVLKRTAGNKSQAARLLGITRKTLRERLERD